MKHIKPFNENNDANKLHPKIEKSIDYVKDYLMNRDSYTSYTFSVRGKFVPFDYDSEETNDMMNKFHNWINSIGKESYKSCYDKYENFWDSYISIVDYGDPESSNRVDDFEEECEKLMAKVEMIYDN